jgi:nicotinamidase-related amidase
MTILKNSRVSYLTEIPKRRQKVVTSIPKLHPQWQSLDLAELLTQPTAFVSISQNNSLYSPVGAQSQEKQWERPSLENTVKVAIAARKAGAKFFWISYNPFREDYPQNPLDEAQYRYWYKPYKNWSKEQKQWNGELACDLKALQQPQDVELFETAQSSLTSTTLPLYLHKWGIRNLLIAGMYLDLSIEGNVRAARDSGLVPIVIGDACACKHQEDEMETLRRINNHFAPVISADFAVQILARDWIRPL